MQTRPTCSIENYGFIEFVNYTDTRKIAWVKRRVEGANPEPAVHEDVEARTIHTYRLKPGYYYIGTKLIDGTTHINEGTLRTCGTITVKMEMRKEPVKEFKIKPRRQND